MVCQQAAGNDGKAGSRRPGSKQSPPGDRVPADKNRNKKKKKKPSSTKDDSAKPQEDDENEEELDAVMTKNGYLRIFRIIGKQGNRRHQTSPPARC